MKKILLIVVLFVLYSGSVQAQKFQFKSNPENHFYQNLVFQLEDYKLKTIETDNQKFVKVISGAGVHLNKKGFARLPVFSTAVLLADDKDMDLVVIPGEYEDIKLEQSILPSKGIIYRNQDPKQIKYEVSRESLKDKWYPEKIALLSKPYIVNSVRGASIRFYPIQYNAVKKILRVYKSIEVKLISNQNLPTNPLIRKSGSVTSELDAVYRSLFINYQKNIKPLKLGQYGDMLVITTNRDADAIKPYIEWKRAKGYKVDVEVVKKGANVKSLIKKKYDDNNKLFYVTIAGDYEDIKSDLGTRQNAPMDPMLGCVAGNDYFPDISIGRFSANNPAEITAQVNKTIKYESEPDLNGDWYSHALHIASDEGEGKGGDDNETDIEHHNIIWKNKLKKFTYTKNDTLYDPGVTAKSVLQRINNKVGLINYIGHGFKQYWKTSGFNNENIDKLSNKSYLPWIISVACLNGAFHNGECFAEHFVKKADGGAVMFLGGTINQAWTAPMMGQDYIMDILIGGYDYSKYPNQSGISTNEQRTTAGSIIFNSLVLMLVESESLGVIETVKTWTIFGDPALQVRSAKPAKISMDNSKIETGKVFTTKITGEASVKGIVVSINQRENVYTGIADAAGNVSIKHDIGPGRYSVVASGFNTSTIVKKDSILSDSYYPVLNRVVVKENGLKNNGKIEFNDNLKLELSFKNFGKKTLPACNAVLTISDQRVTVINKTLKIAEIAPLEKYEAEGFDFKISKYIPNGEVLTGKVTITAGNFNIAKTIKIKIDAPDIRLKNTIIDDANFNKDYILDAGETVDYHITLCNKGNSDAVNSTFKLKASDQYLTVENKTVNIDTFNINKSRTIIFKIFAKNNVPLEKNTFLILNKTFNGFSSEDTLKLKIGKLPVYKMVSRIDTIESGRFFDSGGKDGNYKFNENLVYTIYPAAKGKAVQLVFEKFDIEDGYDFMTIYNGSDTTSALIGKGKYTGKKIDKIISATNNKGALTIKFVSDGVVTESGWEAIIKNVSLTSVKESNSNIPEKFDLAQNYPNPFNPSTKIMYSLPEISVVTIDVFNVMGQLVKRLVDKEEQKAGRHFVIWNGTNSSGETIASGIYFYRIEAGGFVKSKKMIFLK